MTVVIRKKNPTTIFSGSKCIVLNNKDQGTVIAIGYGKARRKNSKGTGQGQGLYGRSQKNEIGSRRKKRRKRKVSVAKAISGNTYVSIRQEKILAVGDARGRQVELIQ